MRAALYARYSADRQNPRSIEDQLRLCRERAAALGAVVVESYVDAAISGASMANRPGVLQLMADAKAGRFDAVIVEDMDRLSRDQEDTAAIFKRLTHGKVKIIALNDGEITDLHVGIKGIMSARYLKELGDKTRRGQLGNIEEGLATGGLTYGYVVDDRQRDAKGDRVPGHRAIDPPAAAIVLRIITEYTEGKGPRAIARRLNAEGVPAPGGGSWTASTIIGNRARGTGILNNELYTGRLVYNRQQFVKDPDSGKRQARPNPPELWKRREVPHLRIVPQALWERCEAIKGVYRNSGVVTRRPKHLLSGLLFCGVCGGTCTNIGRGRLACAGHKERDTCSNGRTVRLEEVEARVLHAIKERLLQPDKLAQVIREMQDGMRARDQAEQRRRSGHVRELEKVSGGIRRLVGMIERGVDSPGLTSRLLELEAKRAELVDALKLAPEPAAVQLHPGLAGAYRQKVETLQAALARPDTAEKAKALLREMIERVILHPRPQFRGGVSIEVTGRLAGLLGLGEQTEMPSRVLLVAGAGFEPATFRL